MIGGMLGRINTAEKMTVEQLQLAMERGSLPAYIGVPILEEKLQMRDRAAALSYGQQVASQPPIIDEIMQRARSEPGAAQMVQGIDQLPTQLRPEAAMAKGGIVALADGGAVRPKGDGWWDRVKAKFEEEEWRKYSPLMQDLRRLGIGQPSVQPGYDEPVYEEATTFPIMDPAARSDLDTLDEATAKEHEQRTASRKKAAKGDVVAPKTEADRREDAPPKRSTPPSAAPSAGIDSLPSNLAPTEIGQTEEPQGTASATDRYIEMLMADREAASAERGNAKNMALIQAGLAMMAGDSPHALQNIGAGGAAGLQYYNDAIKDISGREREALTTALGADMQRERMASEKDYRDASLEIKRAELGLRGRQLDIMAARAAASAASAGIDPRLYAKTNADALKLLVGDGMVDLSDPGEFERVMSTADIIARRQLGLPLPVGATPQEEQPNRYDGSGFNWRAP